MNDVLEKLKESINFDLLSTYDFRLLEQKNFVPISVKNSTVYVVTDPRTNKEEADLFTKGGNYKSVKFIQIKEEEMDNLLEYLQQQPSIKKTKIKNDPKKRPSEEILHSEPPKKRIGEIFIDSGAITKAQLEQALDEGKKRGIPLGSMLYRMDFITLKQLKEALQKQQGIEAVDSTNLKINDRILNLLPEDFIRTNKVLPISSDGRDLVVGMVNPNDSKVLKDIVYLSGQKPRAMLITHYEFQNFINNFFDQKKKESSNKETKEIIKQIEEEVDDNEADESLWEQVERELQDSTGSVAKFVNKIITDAIELKASDIHIEPRLKNYVVRYRIDGILKHVVDVPSRVEQAVITRFKVLARVNIAEHRRPQDGSFSLNYKGRSYDFRVNTLPITGQEKLVVRVLAPAVSLDSSEKEINLVGATNEDIEKVKKMVTSPNGIILTSGPTGSGKTTTLYALLSALNDEKVNITTIEDPVEIKLEGVNQSQVNEKAGINFASCLRSILRQDPDIILVGEIRDYETLEVAISAALTGHLVLSTVHTNSAAATVTRLIEMGAKDYLVSSTLSGIISQRLVRKLCDECKESYFATREEAENLFVNEEEIQRFMKTKIYRKKGCNCCDFKGYSGRLGVFEILPINKEIKKLVAVGAHDIEIEEAAIACGMKTLNQECLGHIIRGETTVEEFIRVLGIVNE